MSILKKRSTAIIIFMIVVVLFSFLGCKRSLGKACRQAEEAFFDKSLLKAEGGYSAPADHLENCVDLTNRLLSVIGTDGDWAAPYAAVKEARSALDEALTAKDIPAIGEANEALAEAVAQVEAAKNAGAPLAESYDDYDKIISDFHSAQSEVDNSAYNAHIQAFRDEVLTAFPASLLRHVTGVKAPETFP